jgi:hypothetical protein
VRVTLALALIALLASSPPANDRTLVLGKRAGPLAYRSTDGSTFAAARTRFGTPSSMHPDGNTCRVTWRPAGLAIRFAGGAHPCAHSELEHGVWYGMTLFGRGWHTTRGIRIGSTVTAVRHVYPHAAGASMLALVWWRDQELSGVLLEARIRNGRVVALDVNPDFVY